MSITASPVRLRTQDGHLVATCTTCDLVLHQHDAFDRDIALGTLLSHYPESPLAIHRGGLPGGWDAKPR